jgi:hypothetical protein
MMQQASIYGLARRGRFAQFYDPAQRRFEHQG